jgi:hypothetical protein
MQCAPFIERFLLDEWDLPALFTEHIFSCPITNEAHGMPWASFVMNQSQCW